MKFIELEVKTAFIVHGYDENNQEIREEVIDGKFETKLIAIDRIQSIGEEYLLVSSSHSRMMYWEYNYTMGELNEKLKLSGLIIA